jgi:hypothetical protein
MSTRKTTTERIELHKEKMEQMQNEMKALMRKHNAEERKKRNHRISTRGAHLEKLLPDTIELSDERFFTFLEKTTANDFGRRILATIIAEQEKENAKVTVNSTAADGGTDAAELAVKTQNGGKTAAKAVIAEDNGDNTDKDESGGTKAS